MPRGDGTRRLAWSQAVVVAGLTAGALLIAAGLAYRSLSHDSRPRETPSTIDVGFAQDMMAHHAQALVMAGDALTETTTPAVVNLARQIVTNQSREIGMLQGWLALWHQPQVPSGPAMSWMSSPMPGMSMKHGGPMPGMASQTQLNRLATLQGASFDALFLDLMIRHHLGGVAMANYAAAHAALPEVRSAAELMAYDQQLEVAVMNGLIQVSRHRS